MDATLLWVCLLHDAWRWGLPDEDVEPLLDPMERCLGWLSDYGRVSGPFVRYVNSSGRGLANQGWKDSGDGIQFRDGNIATGSLALCEAQGYAYEAALAGANLLEAYGRPGADRWRQYAFELALRFRERFWIDDENGPYPAVALDGTGRLVDSLTSNIGHLLGTGLLDAEESNLVARRLARFGLERRLRPAHACSVVTGLQPARLPQWLRVAARHGHRDHGASPHTRARRRLGLPGP